MPVAGLTIGLSWAAWIVIVPLFGALLAGLWPRAGGWVALLVALLTLGTTLGGALHVWFQGPAIHALGGWDAPLGIALVLDGLAAFMLLLTAVVGLFVTLYAMGYVGGQERAGRFWVLWLWLWAAMNALYLSGDVFNLYVALELVVLASVALVALATGGPALVASMRYLLLSLLGSLAYLMGVALLYAAHGVLDLASLAMQVTPTYLLMLVAALMTVGLMAKTALFPLHGWLAPGHGSAPAPASAILSALVVKVSFYLMLRLWLTLFPDLATPLLGMLMGALGGVAVIWGGVMAMAADRLKLFVAYSTVAQVGYLSLFFPFMLAVPGGWRAVVFFAAAHACAKATVFMAAGTLQRAAGHDRMTDLADVMRGRPITSFAMGIAGASLVGLPFTGGFIAKWLLVETAIAGDVWPWAVVVVVGGLLAGAYVFRLLGPAFLAGRGSPGRPIAGIMEWSTLGMALVSILLGFAGAASLELLGATMTGPGGL
ncbi:complex I subunit 5 family protein [Ectothiorhodospira sp. BSL-9]|uniref:complex I subunit 5 family protein n=1 Tax=Ectothiorhodospira sp. BSL-9 TaxID=1442136 RepID=UPI0007B45216|nr:proton-conducting transporter membrane subunit [Ectothiorhodospira sp. BSL-9]ANB01525.1 oxidoreductase [Ectothiorhodospira sp. BSL-9]TVQ71041.1 MAG: oxidoreductase [Chromatiaceae bacterium]